MGNKYKDFLFICFFVVLLSLPKLGSTQTTDQTTNLLGGDVLLKEYLFPVASYEELNTPQVKKAVECEGFAKYADAWDTNNPSQACTALTTSGADITKTAEGGVLSTAISKFNYKFTVNDRGSFVFKIDVNNKNDNFANLTNQQLDYIFNNDAGYDSNSYMISGPDKNLAILEYNDLTKATDVISGTQKYDMFRGLVFSVYLDDETAANRKGFIIVGNTDPTSIQEGSVLLGNIAPGEHKIFLHFLSNFTYDFSADTSLPDYFDNFKNADLNKDGKLEAQPLISSVAIDGVTPAEDIVGIRIYSNKENKDPLTWYKDNVINASKSVKSMTVDGYKAIRDDRTVYVDAANLSERLVCVGGGNDAKGCTVESTTTNECPDGACKLKKFFYTNIYVIAYNQKAAPATQSIFDQMLANWKFNKNVMEGLTFAEAEQIKNKFRRDTIRLADLNVMDGLIENYKSTNGKYPTLEAGTFVRDHSISTWPSWQATLGNKLGTALPVDPLNIMATGLRGTYDCSSADPAEKAKCQNVCTRDSSNNPLTGCPTDQQCLPNYCSICPPGFDPATCWDKLNSKFAFGTYTACPADSLLKNAFTLGGTKTGCNNDGAFVYQYTALNNGQSYALNYRLEYQVENICAPGQCVYENKCYPAGACLDVRNKLCQKGFVLSTTSCSADSDCTALGTGYTCGAGNLLYPVTYCYLGTWRNSCGDGFVQSQCGEQCDSSAPTTANQSWCDTRYGPQDWYSEGKINATCTASCQVQEFTNLTSLPPAYSTDPTILNCGGFCGDNIVQAKSGEECDQGATPTPLAKPEQRGAGGVSQTSQYMCSGSGAAGGAPTTTSGAACLDFAGWNSSTNTYDTPASSCSTLPASGWVSKPASTDNILSSGGFRVSYSFSGLKAGTYNFKISAANFGDNINALTNEQIDYLFNLKRNLPADSPVYLFNLNTDGSLVIPEYSAQYGATSDSSKYNLLRSLIFSVYVDSDGPTDTPKGFVIIPAVNAENKQNGNINLALSAGDHTLILHFVGDHFYAPLGSLTLPANVNNFTNVDLDKNQTLDINPLVYSVTLLAPELNVGKCKTYGGWCGDGVGQMQFGEQCDTKTYLTPVASETVNLVRNPGFENVFSPWQMTDGTVDLDAHNYFEGRGSLRVNANTTSVSLFQPVSMFRGKAYNIFFRAKIITGNINSIIFQAGDQSAADFTNSDQADFSADSAKEIESWQYFQTNNFTPSASRYKFRLQFTTDAGTSFYVDSVKITPVDPVDRPQYQCGNNSSGQLCQFKGGYCGDGIIQSGFGENCDDRVGLSCTRDEECGKGQCGTCSNGDYNKIGNHCTADSDCGTNGLCEKVCMSASCNDICKSTYCGDGLVQKPNSAHIYEVCDWGSDPLCAFDCQHIKMGGQCDADFSNTCSKTYPNDPNCRQCAVNLSCTIRNFGDTDKKCLGARGSYGCQTNDDCILGYYCDRSTTKCEPEISTYLEFHPEPITSLALPLPAPPTPPIKYDINISSCPDLQSITLSENKQFINDRCTDLNWEASDNISRPVWLYSDALENGCSGTSRLPNVTELYSLVRQTDTGFFYSDKEALRLCPLACQYDENVADLCTNCADDNYLYWSSTCVRKDANGNCLKALAVNFKYGSIEEYNVSAASNNKFKIHCLRDTECGNGNLEEGETCEFYKAYSCVGGPTPGAACSTDAQCGTGGTCPTQFIEQQISKKCTDFGYDGGFLHCDKITCGFKLNNCYLDSKPNQTCSEICQGRKTLVCNAVGLNVSKEADYYDLSSTPPNMSIADDKRLMDIDPSGNCQPGRQIDCNYRFVDRKANCKDTSGTYAPFRSEYSYCNCLEPGAVEGGGAVAGGGGTGGGGGPAPTCLGAPPDNATICPSPNATGLVTNTGITVVNTCSNDATKCEYTCNTGYKVSGNACVAFACTGSITDPHASICPSPNATGLTADTTRTLVATCSGDATKCEYTCNAGYKVSGNACEVYSCTGPAFGANASTCGGLNATGLTGDTNRTLVAACSNDPTNCEYVCNSGYALSGGVCVAVTYSCTGTTPTNATICTGDDTGLTANTPKTVVASCTTGNKCEHTCNSGYTLSAGVCVAVTYSCTGTTPSNATICSGDDTDLTANTAKTSVNYCTNTKCEYRCNTGYVLVGGSCVSGKLVFVSSAAMTGNLGGVSGATTECQTEANAKGLNGTFKAWISTTANNDPDSTFTKSTTTPYIPYYLLSGVQIASKWSDLIDGTLATAINVDINGNPNLDVPVWTNTDSDGTAVNLGNYCNGYVSADSNDKGKTGLSSRTDNKWTNNAQTACNTTARLYCFGQ